MTYSTPVFLTLPEPCRRIIDRLQENGFHGYAVGGCVRDSLLGRTPHDWDITTDARPEQVLSIFRDFHVIETGLQHGTVTVRIDHEPYEVTTFRVDGEYSDGRHPDEVRFTASVEEDLARRDFTVNAMAYNDTDGLIDPFGGQKDLKNKILRTVGAPEERFSEDALRILRGVRFAVRFGLQAEEKTLQAMQAQAPSMDKLAKERIFEELCKLLPVVKAKDLLDYQRILVQVLPPLAPCVNFDQHNSHHKYDVYTHIAQVVEAVPGELTLRWAALLHDCGKPACFELNENGKGRFHGHAKVSAEMAEELLVALKAPTALREQVVFLIAHHMTPLVPDKRLLRRQLGKYGEQAFFDLLTLQQADFCGKGTGEETEQFQAVYALAEEVLAEEACLTVKDLCINGRDLQALGFAPGPKLGECLSRLLELVQDEEIPNERQALLDRAMCLPDHKGK